MIKSKQYPLTASLFYINIVVMLVLMVLEHQWYKLDTSSLLLDNALSFGSPSWKILTSMFLHANIFHLYMNMYALRDYGRQLEDGLGQTAMFSIYILSGLLGGFFVIFLGASQNLVVGASGAIVGLLSANLVNLQFMKNRTKEQKEKRLEAIITIVLLLALGFIPQISALSHLGGLIGGAISVLPFIWLKQKNHTLIKPKEIEIDHTHFLSNNQLKG